MVSFLTVSFSVGTFQRLNHSNKRVCKGSVSKQANECEITTLHSLYADEKCSFRICKCCSFSEVFNSMNDCLSWNLYNMDISCPFFLAFNIKTEGKLYTREGDSY